MEIRMFLISVLQATTEGMYFSPKDVIEIVSLVVLVVGAYWRLRLKMKTMEQDLKDKFNEQLAGVAKTVTTGVNEMMESYHELDKKIAELIVKYKFLAERLHEHQRSDDSKE
jgi:hypothetical protein